MRGCGFGIHIFKHDTALKSAVYTIKATNIPQAALSCFRPYNPCSVILRGLSSMTQGGSPLPEGRCLRDGTPKGPAWEGNQTDTVTSRAKMPSHKSARWLLYQDSHIK